ncbi:AAA family ATPase [Peribacillus frigoritolerans]|uniref:AAA family ATPase n=1 Tax=Peribacillus frigoritolerans TaxID=450367 RepID=UPI003ED095BB
MELIYLWVEKFRNIKQLGFSFSTKYIVDFKFNEKMGYKEINIKELKENINLFENKIDNVTAIIGKNGSGKTNILDLIGMRMNDRKKYRDARYFIIYHHEGNLFSIEGNDFNLVKQNIKYYPNRKDSIHVVTDPYSMLIKKKKNTFEYGGYLQFEESQYNKINIFNLRNTFRQGYSREGFKIDSDYSNFFDRLYLNPVFIGDYAKYSLITYFNSLEKQGFIFNLNEMVLVKILPDIHYTQVQDLKLKFNYKKNLFRREKENKIVLNNNKEKFIFNFLKSYVYYSFESYTEIVKNNDKVQQLKGQLENVENLGNDRNYLFKLLEIIYLNFEKQDLDYGDMQTYLDTIKNLLVYINKISEKYFSEHEISIPIGLEEEKNLLDLLLFLDHINNDEINYLNNSIKLRFEPMSSGEEALINTFSSLFFGIKLKKHFKKEKAIILLDEPDLFMHPEWSRVLLSELFNLLNIIDEGYESYQLIITTHSPFIVSDLPKNNIISLEKSLETGLCQKVSFNNEEQTFASNVHSLLSNKFFMNATIGEFAKTKIDYVDLSQYFGH